MLKTLLRSDPLFRGHRVSVIRAATVDMPDIQSSLLTRLSYFRVHTNEKTETNSKALVREWNISTERLPLVGVVCAHVCGLWVSRSQNGSPRPYSRVSRPKPLLFFPISSSTVLTRLSGPRSRPTTTQKIWQRRESNPGSAARNSDH
jgi:hypothetical protein